MTNANLVIRPAREDDAAAVAAVYAPYVRDTAVSFEVEPPTASVMAQRIGETLATHPWLVALRNSNVVAYAYAGKHSQRAAYRWTVDVTIYVSDQERRSGLGRSLYRVLLATLQGQGFRSAFAEIVLPNPGSIRLHEAAGFKYIGVHKEIGFKLGSWQDIGYWRLGLAHSAACPSEPIPFATFQHMPAFAQVLARASEKNLASVTPAEREPDAETDQDDACSPALDSRPEGIAGEFSEGAAGQRDGHVDGQAGHLKQEPQQQHLRARVAASGINELWQKGKEENDQLRIEQIGHEPL